jgi:hypothetical protein
MNPAPRVTHPGTEHLREPVMNEITIYGNVGSAPKISHGRNNGTAVVNFAVAINSRRFDRARGEWISRPTVWRDVVVFGDRAGRGALRLQTPQGSGRTRHFLGTVRLNAWRRKGGGQLRKVSFRSADLPQIMPVWLIMSSFRNIRGVTVYAAVVDNPALASDYGRNGSGAGRSVPRPVGSRHSSRVLWRVKGACVWRSRHLLDN